MKQIAFCVPGEPKAKARPRIIKYGAFTPKETVEYENWIRTCFQLAYPGGNKVEGQLQAKIRAFHSIPKAASKKKRVEMLDGSVRPTKKPDLDNIAKAVLDSLNKIAFDDDKQVVSLAVEKFYSDEPKIEILIEPMGVEK